MTWMVDPQSSKVLHLRKAVYQILCSCVLIFNPSTMYSVTYVKVAYDNELHNSYHVCTVMLYVHTNSS